MHCCLQEWLYAIIVSVMRIETKASKNLWRVNDERSCAQLHVRRTRLERKLSSANFDPTGKLCGTVVRKPSKGQKGGGWLGGGNKQLCARTGERRL